MTTKPPPPLAHTPGPWEAIINPNGVVYVDFSGTDARGICDLYHLDAGNNVIRKENAEANARLIASAPDLLEVLITIAPVIFERV